MIADGVDFREGLTFLCYFDPDRGNSTLTPTLHTDIVTLAIMWDLPIFIFILLIIVAFSSAIADFFSRTFSFVRLKEEEEEKGKEKEENKINV